MPKPTDIILGSGYLYSVEFTGDDISDIPADNTFEVDANCIGLIQGGAKFSYKPTYYTATDDMQIASKTVLVSEEAHLTSSIVTTTADKFAQLCATATVTSVTEGLDSGKKTVKIGGLANDAGKRYAVRFVHIDGKHRLTVIGVNQGEFALQWQTNKETVIAVDYLAQSMDGTGVKAVYEDTSAVVPANNG